MMQDVLGDRTCRTLSAGVAAIEQNPKRLIPGVCARGYHAIRRPGHNSNEVTQFWQNVVRRTEPEPLRCGQLFHPV